MTLAISRLLVYIYRMGDDLFQGRFKPGAQASKPVDDDSRSDYRQQRGRGGRPTENDIISAIDALPALPDIVNKIMTQVGNSYSSAADLEELIKQDMVLTGRLLKMVNSPFYGLGHPVASVTQAISLIGFASLKSLVLAASTSNLLMVDLASYGFAPHGLWRNSIATAAVARAIGLRTSTHKDDAEEYFVAGLLRDVGMLVLGPFLTRRQVQLRSDVTQTDIISRERQALGFDHCWVGDRVSEKWRLPEALRVVLGKHHRVPADISEKTMRQLAAVRLAERLVYATGTGLLADHPFDQAIDGNLLHAVGLDPGSFQSLMSDIPRLITAIGDADA